jgi:hypothetical protein
MRMRTYTITYTKGGDLNFESIVEADGVSQMGSLTTFTVFNPERGEAVPVAAFQNVVQFTSKPNK